MQTLRLALTTTVVLTLLGVPSSAALGQGSAEAQTDTSAMLQFTVDFGGWTTYPQPSVEDGRNEYREFRRVIDVGETGDPRLNGQLWMNQNYDVLHDTRGVLAVGTAGIDLDDGRWRGTFRGYGAPGYEGLSLVHIDLHGEGAYEGLSAMLFLDTDEETVTGNSMGSIDVEGIVFSGGLPPMPDMPAE